MEGVLEPTSPPRTLPYLARQRDEQQDREKVGKMGFGVVFLMIKGWILQSAVILSYI
jgi:hypothetical protein